MPRSRAREKTEEMCRDNDVSWQLRFSQTEEIGGPVCSTICDLFISTFGAQENIDAFLKFASAKKSQIIAHQKNTAKFATLPSATAGISEDEAKFIAITRRILTAQEQTSENLIAPTFFKPTSNERKHTTERKRQFETLKSQLRIQTKKAKIDQKNITTDFFESSSLGMNTKNRLASENTQSENLAYQNLGDWLIKKIDALEEPTAFKFSLNDTYHNTDQQRSSNRSGHSIAGFKIDGKILIFDPNAGMFSMNQLPTPEKTNDNRVAWLANYLALYKKLYPVPHSYFQAFKIDMQPTLRPT